MAHFIDRDMELQRLLTLIEKKTASFVIIKGRRRIGKSRLIKEFSKNFENYYSFIGLTPDKKTTANHQLEEFSRQMAREFKTAMAYYPDWSDAFWILGERVKKRPTLIVFDEISWMGSKDPTFLGKIKNLWDQQLKENDHLIFIVCGSASAWIEKNILSSTGFVGRISLTLTLHELSLSSSAKFWPKNISAYEKLKALMITGGIPKYLEEINSKISAEENIRRLCFIKGGFLVDEFMQIFSDIFTRKSNFYKKIVTLLADGPRDQTEIFQLLNLKQHGRVPEYLRELELSGFITRDYSWNIKIGKDSDLSRYRLSDNYLRFYLKYIEQNLNKINRDAFVLKSLAALPGWYSMMGFQFENLVLNNRKILHAFLGIKSEDIICENPFFQKKTTRSAGCQIDYMIQTKYSTLYICEIKFLKSAIEISIIEEVQKKIDTISASKRFSYRPVLVHVNGVTEDVLESDYFSAIVDMSIFLK